MKNDNNFLKNISVSKHGIHDIILELTYKFNFHKLLLHGNLNMVFVALCIGLILFNNPTATHIAQKLGWVSHDAITRLLPLISVNNNNIIILFIQAIQSQTACLGYLIIDDVIIRKPYGKSIFPTSYVYDHTNKRYAWGMHIVVLLWSNGWIKVPVAFRIWIPKEKCEVYHSKGELAIDMINFVHKFGLAAEYVTFDTWYASKALLTLLKKHGYSYVCMIKNNRKVLYNNRFNFNVRTICLLHSKKQFRYYPGTGFYIKAVTVILPGVGKVKLAIVKNGYNASIENTRFIITDMLDTPAQSIVKKYLCRWDIETFFRDIKQYLNFEKVQARDPKKLEGYFSAMFISFVFIQILQVQNNFNTVGETVSFLQDFVQIKVNNVVYIINVTSKHLNSKQVIDVTNPVATTIWDKLSA
ncbi:MAG: transposase [Spirochaetota bacterium]